MGRHADEQRRRGVAAWPIVTGVSVVVIGGLLIAYFIFLSKDSASTDTSCTSSRTVEVIAGPEAAPVVTEVAATYNTTNAQARGACLTVNVTALDSTAAAASLAQNWNQPTPAPSVWVPDAVGAISDLTTAQPTMTAGMIPDPLATSPVVLAMNAADAQALTTPLTWADLTSSGVRLGLANPQSDPATYFALQSVLAKSGTDQKPLTDADVTAGAAKLATLAAASSTTSGANSALTTLTGRSADFTAVPVVEKDLAAFNTKNGDGLSAVYPVGSAVGYSITAVGLAASWVDATAQDGASAFISYLSKPEARKLFQQDGFRVSDLPPATAAHGVDTATAVTRYPGAGSGPSTAMAGVLATVPKAETSQEPTSQTPAPATSETTPPSQTTAPVQTDAAVGTSGPEVPITSAEVITEPAVPTGPVITFVVDASAGMSSIEGVKPSQPGAKRR